jgi:hypothetical protein
MYTSILMFALSGLAPAAEVVDTPAWVMDYSAARKQGARSNKPLAVVLSPGATAWGKLSRDGELSSAALKLLKAKYVCVFVNTATAEGKRMAAAFEMSSGLGIIISDRTGELQAFRHEGDLTNANLLRHLQRYADPDRVVARTETNPSHSTEVSTVRYIAPPVQGYYGGSMGGFYPSGGRSFGGGC